MPRAFELKCLWQTGLVMAVVALIPPALPGQPARRDAASLNQPVPFIPRAVLLQPAQYRRVQISPDGQWLAYITASVHGPEVHVAPIDNLGATWALKLPDATDYQDFRWAFTNQHLLLYAGGPQRYLYSYHIKEAKVTALSPQDGSTANLVSLSERSPTQAMVTLVAGGQTTLSRVNIVTGQRQPIHVSRKFDGFLVDGSYRLRLAYGRTPDEGRIFALAEGQDEALWPSVLRIEPEDCPYTRPIAFDARGDRLYMIDTRTSSRSELKALDLVTSAQETLASSPTLSVDGVLLHPSQRTLQAVRFSGIHTDWDFVDEEVAADVEYLGSLADGEIQIVSRSLDDEHWIVTFESDSAARLYFLFDRVARAANHLFASHQPLEQYKLIPMHTAEVGGEDSSTIGFFSLPTWALSQDRADRPTMPLPSVVIVHDTSAPIKHCLSPLHQLLANRGYAVISVNQSPARTHNEATLAAQWAVSEGIARVDRIAVLGRGSGTDRALEAIARQPDSSPVLCWRPLLVPRHRQQRDLPTYRD